jgi:stage III sporulation protein AB
MFRLIGCICVLTGMGGYGICLAADYEKHLQALTKLEEIVTVLIGYISYERDTLIEALKNCSERIEGTGQIFLQRIVARMEEKAGDSIAEVWQEESAIWKDELEKEDCEKFGKLFTQSGYLERSMQLRLLENYREAVKEKIIEQTEKKEGKLRIYYATGIMGGLFFCILLW